MEFKNKVIAYCKERNANFLDFEKYVSLIEEHNKNINLTGFSGESLWEEGILNSLLHMNSSTKDKSEIKNFRYRFWRWLSCNSLCFIKRK